MTEYEHMPQPKLFAVHQISREEGLAALLVKHVPPQQLEGPLFMRVTAFRSIPESWSKKKQSMAAAGEIRPTGKPDLDNILKHIKDVMTQLHFWKDDSQVVEYLPGTGKFYGMMPRIEVELVPAILPGSRA